MSWIGKLFGSSKAAEKMVDATISGLDKLFYTSEEKSQDRMEMDKFAGNMFIEWQKNTQGQNISRRVLALGIAFTWLFQYWVSMLLNVYASTLSPTISKNNAGGIGNEQIINPHVSQIENISDAVGNNADAMTGAMMLLLGFYFAAPHMGAIVGSAMKKFGSVKIGKSVSKG